MCEKVQYTTYKLALAAAKAVATIEKQSFRVYKCNECDLFHLTSIPNKKLREMPQEKYPKKWEKRDVVIPAKVKKRKQIISDKQQAKVAQLNTYKPFAHFKEVMK